MILVTSNRHKFEEIAAMFGVAGIPLEWKHVKYEEIQEDTTEIISYRSCVEVRKELHDDFFLEDTGLYIPALHGFPGPYSSYVNATIGYAGIQRLVDGKDPTAYFKTVVSLSMNGTIMQFGGVLKGAISGQAKGSTGFGFDPVFIPEGEVLTLAEMDIDAKNRLSHRGRAVSALIRYLITLKS
ncbi:MAG: non-canonical purine NTP pyrophosphatase [Candidatus Thermoplasmatota archaeon]|nr:non-canonical purine NTP pyrophosphatase [Candidatus Thermoplasmatota archaeon]